MKKKLKNFVGLVAVIALCFGLVNINAIDVIILVYLVQASCNIRTSVPVLFGR